MISLFTLALLVLSSNDLQNRVDSLQKDPTFMVQIEPEIIPGKLETFAYLVDHLEEAAPAGRLLNLGKYRSRRLEDGRIFGRDGEGAEGYLSVVKHSHGMRMFFLEGVKKGLFTVRGESVLRLQFEQVAPGKLKVRFKAWNRVMNGFFALMARIFVARSRLVAEEEYRRMLHIPMELTRLLAEKPDETVKALSEKEAESIRPLIEFVTKLQRKDTSRP